MNMSQPRASHLRLVVTDDPAPVARPPRLRFRPIVRLADGAELGMQAQADREHGEARFGRHASELEGPAAWLGAMLERAARLAAESRVETRPLAITAPAAALFDRDAPLAAEAAAMRTSVLPNEIRIDFLDASVAALDDLAMDRLDSFRRRGFRVGLDARRGWTTPMNARARATFDAVRLDLASRVMLDPPVGRLEVAAADGLALIADNARWRDAGALADLGVAYAIAPRADD
jgi:hypothetical protein